MWAASFNSDPEVVKVLLKSGADIHVRENVMGWAMLIGVAQQRETGDTEKVMQILKEYAFSRR